MKPFSKFNCLGLAFAGMMITSCTDKPTAVADYQIVPMPLEITTPQQSGYLLKSGETIYYTAGNEKMKKYAEFIILKFLPCFYIFRSRDINLIGDLCEG